MSSESTSSHTALPPSYGVLVVNLGTPSAPTPAAVRRYLAEFLHDHRVVDLTRWLWCPILHGVILRFRPRRVARNYAKIWTEDGSPLAVYSQRLADALQQALHRSGAPPVPVRLAMTYGEPSIDEVLDSLAAEGVDRLVVLPLYPQYSATTTAAVFDRLARALTRGPWLPSLRLVTEYHQRDDYVDALAASVEDHWQTHGQPERLLLSFHGIPQRLVDAGDPYAAQCRRTGALLAERLGWSEDRCVLAFQSRFGREPWLMPYVDEVLAEWGRAGGGVVDVLCPGFAADCLETLEEIAIQNRALYRQSGGEELRYIPALNDGADHVAMLAALIAEQAQGWNESPGTTSP